MVLKIYGGYDSVVNEITNSNSLGEIVYSKNIDENNTFIVFERYTFRSGNRMTLSIVLCKKDFYVDAHVISSGGGQGMIFNFDWGAGTNYISKFVNVLDNTNIRYETLEE
ncbi:DUF6054 family protein [Mycoplasmatota bacterium WC44]